MNKSIYVNTVFNGDFVIERNYLPADKLLLMLKVKLEMGIAHFVYQKKDGSLREAFGTLHANHIPAKAESEGQVMDKPKPADNPNVQKYFDLEAGAWRAFTINSLISIL